MYPLSGLTIERALTKSIKPRDKQNDNKGRQREGESSNKEKKETEGEEKARQYGECESQWGNGKEDLHTLDTLERTLLSTVGHLS